MSKELRWVFAGGVLEFIFVMAFTLAFVYGAHIGGWEGGLLILVGTIGLLASQTIFGP